MAVLAVVTHAEHTNDVLTWAARFADALEVDLQVLCWSYAPTSQYPLLAEEKQSDTVEVLTERTREWIESAKNSGIEQLNQVRPHFSQTWLPPLFNIFVKTKTNCWWR